MGYIENSGCVSGGEVLLDDSCFILNRHFPSAEFNDFCAQLHMPIKQDGSFKVSHLRSFL